MFDYYEDMRSDARLDLETRYRENVDLKINKAINKMQAIMDSYEEDDDDYSNGVVDRLYEGIRALEEVIQ